MHYQQFVKKKLGQVVDVVAGRPRADEGKQFREDLGQELLNAYLGRCNQYIILLFFSPWIDARIGPTTAATPKLRRP